MHLAELKRICDPLSVRTVLLLPFEDEAILSLATREFPRATQHIIRKEDLAGLSPARIIARIRQVPVDLIIASIGNSAVRRNRTTVELMVALSRACYRLVRIKEDDFAIVARTNLVFRILPLLVAALVVGLGCVLWTYGLLFFYRLAPRPARIHHQTTTENLHRILFIRCDLAGSVQAGGSATHIAGMVNAFRRAGLEVVYLADQQLEALPSDVQQICIKPFEFLGIFDEFQLLGFNLQLMRRLPTIIRNVRPHFIYQRHAALSFAVGVIARRTQLPLVLEVNASEVWVKRHWSRLVFSSLATRCEALALALADRIAVISRGVLEQLGPYEFDRARCVLNPNGVDPDVFHPDIDGTPIRDRYGLLHCTVVGFIGTFARWHGVETLFEAAILSIRADSTLRFLFVGEGSFRSTLEKRVEDLGVQTMFVFTGLVPPRDAPRYLAACDILVSPHLGFEDGTKFFGSPMKLFEYMAMGKAIIASRLEQIGEVIRDGINGLQMTPGDSRQLAELILKLAHDEDLRAKLGRQARQDVISHCTWDANVERILQSFQTPN